MNALYNMHVFIRAWSLSHEYVTTADQDLASHHL